MQGNIMISSKRRRSHAFLTRSCLTVCYSRIYQVKKVLFRISSHQGHECEYYTLYCSHNTQRMTLSVLYASRAVLDHPVNRLSSISILVSGPR